MLAHIRAIYLPVAQSASKDYPHLSTWVQVNFALERKDLRIFDPIVNSRRGGWSLNDTTPLRGLGVHSTDTLGLDVRGLVELLTIPRQFRKNNPYEAKLIRSVPPVVVKTVPVQGCCWDAHDLDYPSIKKAHSGLDLMWKKAEPKDTWLEDTIKNALVFGIGFIPEAGPFLSIAFSLTWTAMKDENAFWREASMWLPTIKLDEVMKADLKDSFAEIRELIDPAFLDKKNVNTGKLNAKVEPVQKTSFDKADKTLRESGDLSGSFNASKKDTGGAVLAENKPTAAASFGGSKRAPPPQRQAYVS